MKLSVLLLTTILLFSILPEGECDFSARLCRWLKRNIGWGCDDPVSREIWRGYNRLRGIRSCNDLCKRKKFKGGSCKSGGDYDTSSWCPKGQMCTCD